VCSFVHSDAGAIRLAQFVEARIRTGSTW
jgi:hypothetical protein